MREIVYTINNKKAEPNFLMWGGVENEHNATVVAYKIDREYYESLGENVFFRIDFASDCAGYDPSENLMPDSELLIKRAIPKKFTQYGGKMRSTLVITIIRNGSVLKEVISIPSEIFFTTSKRRNDDLVYNLSACEEYLLSLLDRAEKLVANAESMRDDVNNEIKSIKKDVDFCVKKDEFADSKGNAGILRINSQYGVSSGRYGNSSPESGDTIIIQTPSNGLIKQRTQKFMPITPSNVDYAVKCALTDAKISWTDDEKAKAKAFLGIKEETVTIIDSAVLNQYNNYSCATSESLEVGKTYRWSYYCSAYPGWLVNDGTKNPQQTKQELVSTAQNVTVGGINYVGFTAKCFNWAAGEGENEIIVYYDNGFIRTYKQFGGENDIIMIKR